MQIIFYKFFINTQNGKQYFLYFDKRVLDWQFLFKNDEGSQDLSLKSNIILTDYTNLLLPQAIENSAGVIKLFFEEISQSKL